MRSFIALLASAAAGVLVLSYHWRRLPEQVASHFSGSGVADGWMSRDTHFFMASGLVVFLTLMFVVLAVAIQKLDPKWINIPNKDHWFSGELEGRTRLDLSAWSYWYGAAMNVFLLFVFHLVYLANLSSPVKMDNTAMFAGLLVFLGVSIGGVIWIYVRYGDTG